jgi:hypothetical protein
MHRFCTSDIFGDLEERNAKYPEVGFLWSIRHLLRFELVPAWRNVDKNVDPTLVYGLESSNSTCPIVVQACFDEEALRGKNHLTDAEGDDREGASDDDAKILVVYPLEF